MMTAAEKTVYELVKKERTKRHPNAEVLEEIRDLYGYDLYIEALRKVSALEDHYKNRLIKEEVGTAKGNIRFCVIEYLCHYAELDPYKMAASLRLDGYEILFNDSSISKSENEAKRKELYGENNK